MNTAVSLGLSVLMVVALVNLLKGVGLAGKWAALVAVAIGTLLAVADFAFGATGWYVAAISGLKVGLGAAGLYDVTGTKTNIENVNLSPKIQPVINGTAKK